MPARQWNLTTGETGLHLLIAGAAAAAFVLEIHVPLGFTPWLLYVLPLGLTYWSPNRYAPLIMAALCTCLIILGYLFSPAGVDPVIALTNRAFGALTFWILGFLIVRYKLLADQLFHLTRNLGMELTDRTRDLGLAVSALQKEVDRRSSLERIPPEGGTGLAQHVTRALSAEGRRLQETIEYYSSLEHPVDQEEERLNTTRNELMQLGQRLEHLQRELLKDVQSRP